MAVPTPRTGVQRGNSVEERLADLESRRNSTILPGRLMQDGQEVDDWDEATRVGYYWSADGYVGQVLRSPSGIVQQRQKVAPAQSRMETRSFDSSWSPWRREDGLFRGTALERAATPPAYWDMWQDTDGSQRLYVGSKTGTWRRFSGEVAFAAKAWDMSANPLWGRTDITSLPTVLETNETLVVTATTGGTSYSALVVASIVVNPTDTEVTTRLTQFVFSSTQPYAYAWAIQQK